MFADHRAKRQHWPKTIQLCLLHYVCDKGKVKTERLLFKHHPILADFQDEKPGIWIWHDGRVILDLNNDAIRDFAEILATLARKADCWLLQTCMRLNNHIILQDILGRMQDDHKRSQETTATTEYDDPKVPAHNRHP